jgi:hypothetical protein
MMEGANVLPASGPLSGIFVARQPSPVGVQYPQGLGVGSTT